jgi:hypothetical protein
MRTIAGTLVAYAALTGAARAEQIEFHGAFAERAAKIVERPTVHAATSWEPVDADLAVFEWLIDHPAAAGSLWKDLGLEVGAVEVLADGWRSRDPDGVVLEFHRLHESAGKRGYYCKATAPTGAIPRTVTVEFVVLHQIQLAEGPGIPQPVDHMEAWVSAQGAALRLMMKIADGAMTRAVLRSLRETKLYFASVARFAERRPEWATGALRKRQAFLSSEDLVQFDACVRRAAQTPRRPAASATALARESRDAPR